MPRAFLLLALCGFSAPQATRPAPERLAAFSLSGRVVDGAGVPVGGAEVALLRPGLPGISTASSGDGRFTVRAERLPPDSTLVARSPAHGPAFLRDLPALATPVEVGRIVLLPPATIRGRVVDAARRGLGGARIYLEPPVGDAEEPAATSAPDGSFEMGGLPRAVLALGASARGHADLLRKEVSLLDGGATVEIALSLEAPIDGVALDASGAPVDGAAISALRKGAFEPLRRRAAQTDSAGRFRLEGIGASEPIEVTLSKPGLAPARADRGSLPADGRWTLRAGRVATVRAVGEPGLAIAAARYEVDTKVGEGWRREEGDADRAGAIAPDAWRVTLPAGGHARFSVTTEDGRTARSEILAIPAAGAFEVRVAFEKGGTIAGRARLADGSPASGVPVWLDPDGERPLAVRTREDGSFELGDVPFPATLPIEVRSAEWVSEPRFAAAAPGGRTEGIELLLREASRVTGRLAFDGAPPAGETPIAAYRSERAPGGPAGAFDGRWRLLAVGLAGDAGRYSIGPLPPGRCVFVPKRPEDPALGTIRSFLSGFPEPDAARASVRVRPEEEATLDLDLPAPRPSTVRGTVRVNGEPRRDVRVTLHDPKGSAPRGADTDEGGTFRLRLDRGGDFEVRLGLPGFDVARVLVVPDDSDVSVPLDLEAGSVRGAVADRNGSPLALRLRLERPAPLPARRHPAFGEQDVEPWAEAVEAASGPDGAYAFPESRSGPTGCSRSTSRRDTPSRRASLSRSRCGRRSKCRRSSRPGRPRSASP